MIRNQALGTLLAKARQRRVFRVASTYAIVAFLLVQVADLSFPALGLPPWTLTFVVALVILGLPVVLALGWAFDITPRGIERTSAAQPDGPSQVSERRHARGGRDRMAPSVAQRERWRRANEVFVIAAELPPDKVCDFLDRACGPDRGLRREVESLLGAHHSPGPVDRLGRHIEQLVRPLRHPGAAAVDVESAAESGPADATTPSDPELTGGTDRYEVLEKLGGGGMGVVYRARDVRLARTVALKFLSPHFGSDPEAKRRFLFEARAAARLDHPNICTIHEIGETKDGRLFIAMPFYDGLTLKQRLARGYLPLPEALDIAAQIAHGLAKAHDAGIVHRDIKPANVMLTHEGVVKVLDFGIAKLADGTLTTDGAIVGTVAYMSPEQARGETLDHRTDLWSLGVVLHEMLTGERPLKGDQPDVVLAAIRSHEPVRLARLRGSAPAAVVDLVEGLLAKPRAARLPAATVLIRRLQEAADSPNDKTYDDEEDTLTLPPDGERRQVALLAGEIVGYSSLVERLEAATLEPRLARLRTTLAAIARRHGGKLNEFKGDQFHIVFGVPVTHEDDLARALRAALELRGVTDLGAEEPGDDPLTIQAGISTGTVVAHPLDNGDRTYRLAGTPVQTAVRLAAHARAGEVLLEGECERIVHDLFVLAPRESAPAVHGGEPLRACQVLAASDKQARLETTDPQRLTGFTGRARELALLNTRLERACNGEGQVVTVVGEAGMGKSRLLREFRRRLDPGAVRLIRGSCPSSDVREPYAPLVEALLDTLCLERDGPAAELGDRVTAAVRSVSVELEAFLPFYLHLLSVPSSRHPLPRHLEGEQLRSSMREALIALLTFAAAVRPMALLLEDWHWVDDASDEVLKQLIDMVPSYPMLVVVTYRPGDRDAWTSTQARTLLHLAPLDPAETATMIRRVLDATELEGDVTAALHERSGGNPFFVEELCETLCEHELLRVEQGRAKLTGSAGDLRLPATVQGVIRTRLDRLPPDTREVLRVAAVVGRQFGLPVLERMGVEFASLQPALNRLKSLGLIQQTRLVPEPVYRFKHALTQEVAYDTLLQHQRRAHHARAGRALEELYPERHDELADRVAYHFSESEDWRKAISYGRVSASRARALSEFPEALSLLERVEAWLARLPADARRANTEIDVLLEQEELCETLGLRARQQEIITRVIGLLDPEADRDRLAEVHRRQGDIYTLLRRFPEARDALEASLRLTREAGDLDRHVAVLRSLGLMCWHEGRHVEALHHLREALAIDREREELDAAVGDLSNIGQILKSSGDLEGALAAMTEALHLADTRGNELKKGYILHNIANVYRSLGEPNRALEYFYAAADQATKKHLPVQRSFHLTSIAHVHLAEGRIDESIKYYDEAVEVARRARYAEGLAFSLRVLGEVLAGLGRDAESLPHLREAAELYAQLGSPATEIDLWEKTAATHERTGDHRLAMDAWDRVRGLAEREGAIASTFDALEGRARCLRETQPDSAAAVSSLEAGLDLAALTGNRAAEARFLNSLGILEWTRGEYDSALRRYEAALAVFRELDDRVHAGLTLNSMGVTLKALGRTADARARLEEAADINRATGERLLEGHCLAALGELHHDAGELEDAQRCYEASLEIRRAIGDARGESWMLYSLARLHSLTGDGSRARDRLAAALRIGAQRNDAELLRACGEVHV